MVAEGLSLHSLERPRWRRQSGTDPVHSSHAEGRRRDLLVLLVFVSITAAFTLLLLGNRNDDAFITYRHVQNLLMGRGFVFNPTERVLGTTAPGHGLALALFGLVWDDIPHLAMVLSALSAAALAYVLYRVFGHLGRPAVGIVAGLMLLVNAATFVIFPLETVFLCALCWAAIYAYQLDRFRWVALFGALAILVRADAALCLVAIFASDLWCRRQLRKLVISGLTMVAATAPWFLFAWWYYGNPLSNTASTKTGWQGHEWFFIDEVWRHGLAPIAAARWLAVLCIVISGVGLVAVFRSSRYRLLRAVPIWMALYTATYTAMRIFWPHHWYYYPILIGAIVLFAVGAGEIYTWVASRLSPPPGDASRLPYLVIALVGAMLMLKLPGVLAYRDHIPKTWFVGGRDRAYRSTARWLRQHTSPNASVATLEPGTLAYYSDRRMVDMMGLVTLGVGEEMKRTQSRRVTLEWTSHHFDPDYFALTEVSRARIAERLPQDSRYRLEHVVDEQGVSQAVLVYARTDPAP